MGFILSMALFLFSVIIVIAGFFLLFFIVFLISKASRKKISLFEDDSFFWMFRYAPKPSFIFKKEEEKSEKKDFDEVKEGLILMGKGIQKGTNRKLNKQEIEDFKKIKARQKKGGSSDRHGEKRKAKKLKKTDNAGLFRGFGGNRSSNADGEEIVSEETGSGRHKKKEIVMQKLLEKLNKSKKEKKEKKKHTRKGVFFNKKFNSLEEVIDIIQNPELKKSLVFLKNQNLNFIREELLSARIFESEKELIDFIKEEIFNALDNIYHDLKDEVSELRKSGKDVFEIDLRLMQFPLKIRIFLSTYKQEDLQKAIGILDDVKEDLNAFKKFPKNKKNKRFK